MAFNLDAIFNVDRRIVFIFVFLSILAPLLYPAGMSSEPSPMVQTLYEQVERSLDAHRPILVSFEWDPSGAAEHQPMARALMRHIFARGGKAIVMCKGGGLQGMDLHRQVLEDCASEYGKKYGEDYVYLGYAIGSTNLVINLGQNIASVYPKDDAGTDLEQLPVMRGVTRLADFGYLFVLCSGMTTVVDWLTYAQAPFNMNVGYGVLGNVTPDCINYVQSGQIKGLLGGLVGAAQYEQMLANNGITQSRRFSVDDLPASKIPALAAKLVAGNRPATTEFIWNCLTAEQKAAVERSHTRKRDQLSRTDKQALADALNDAITGSDVISASQAEHVALGRTMSDLLKRPDLAGRADQIRRRFVLEELLDGGVDTANNQGRATRWMTPQSIAHVGLIIAILFGNACYLWQRARKAR